MESEFVTQLLALKIEKPRLAEFAKEVHGLMGEFSTPIDKTREAKHRAARTQLVESFCFKWSVAKSWVNDLIDRYEANTSAAERALFKMSYPERNEVPDPRTSFDRATQRSA